jgi:hypothetical protein
VVVDVGRAGFVAVSVLHKYLILKSERALGVHEGAFGRGPHSLDVVTVGVELPW